MTTAAEWTRYMQANARARRAYDTHLAELANREIPAPERNRAKSRRYYATQLAKKRSPRS